MQKIIIFILLLASLGASGQYAAIQGNKDFKGEIIFSKTIKISGVTVSGTDLTNFKSSYTWGNHKSDTATYLMSWNRAANTFMPKTTLNVYSKTQTDSIASLKASLNSPTFTGTVNGITKTMVGLGNVTNESKSTMFSSPTFTGTVTLPTTTNGVTQAYGNSSTLISTTAFVQAALSVKANLSSPSFTGTPSLPTGTVAVTQSVGDNSTSVATTAFVSRALSDTTELSTAITALDYVAFPQATTTEINAISGRPEGTMIYDKTLHVFKFWNGTVWKTITTN